MAQIRFGNANSGLEAGAIYGNVNSTINIQSARSQTLPRPSILIPFARDTDYVNRGTLLEEIHERCIRPGARVGLVGLGGIGKSQLAIEYAYRVRDQSPETWVFWVHASNAARFEQSFRDIADCINIPERADPEADICRAVQIWLRGSKHSWLIILDNVDDAQFLMEVRDGASRQHSRPLRDYLPHCDRGSILLTSRNTEAASRIVEERDIIAVDVMTTTQAATLFVSKLGSVQADQGVIARICKALEYMPLAIVQASSYIQQSAPRCSVTQYLDMLEYSDSQKTSLLDFEAGRLRRDYTANNSIIKTWQITFEHLSESNASAADLLSLISLFDRQAIPTKLLCSRRSQESDDPETQAGQRFNETHPFLDKSVDRDFLSLKSHTRSLLARPANESPSTEESREHISDQTTSTAYSTSLFENDIRTLRRFCFISVSPDGSTFSMHALVQLATRTWLTANNVLEIWIKRSLRHIMDVWNSPVFMHVTEFKEAFPHVKAISEQRPTSESVGADWATVLNIMAVTAWSFNFFTEADILVHKALSLRQKLFGDNHIDTIQSICTLANLYTEKGLLDEAIKLLTNTLEASNRIRGPDHPDALLVLVHLAAGYKKKGSLQAVVALQRKVFDIRMKSQGPNNRSTLSSMEDLADTYSTQERFDLAEKLYSQVLETRLVQFDEDDDGTILCKGRLARMYIQQGRLEEAERILPLLVDEAKETLGINHWITRSTVESLAVLYSAQGNYERAENLQTRVVEVLKFVWGVQHPITLRSMHRLAIIKHMQGRTVEALTMMRECVSRRQDVLGNEHEDTRDSISFLHEMESQLEIATEKAQEVEPSP